MKDKIISGLTEEVQKLEVRHARRNTTETGLKQVL